MPVSVRLIQRSTSAAGPWEVIVRIVGRRRIGQVLVHDEYAELSTVTGRELQRWGVS